MVPKPDPKKMKVNLKMDEDKDGVGPVDRKITSQNQFPGVPRELLNRIPFPNRPGFNMSMGGPGMTGRADGDFVPFPFPPPPLPFNNNNNTPRSDDGGSNESKDVKKPQKTSPEMNLLKMGYGEKEIIDWNKVSLPLKSDLHKLIHQRISNFIKADFIVQIGNHEYRCHLLVLQCYSTFFENLEKNATSVDISPTDVTGDAFEGLYSWMLHLGQESYQLLRRDNILEMFMAAQYLGVKELEEQCWAFIDNEELFSEDTAFLLYLDARRLGNTAVMELMVPRIQRFFLTLVSSKDWVDLKVDEVTVFLRSNYICIHCEMEVFMSGVRWLSYEWGKRNVHLVTVMQCVRFGLIAPWQLVDIRRNPESPEFIEITKDADVQKMVEDGLAFAIIKYWYGHESHDYYHWIDLLGLSEPASRNWAGAEKNYLAYKEFLIDLESYRLNHSRSIADKCKIKGHEDGLDDSCDEIGSRDPSVLGAPHVRKNMPPPNCPIPSMVDFIARRNNDPNVSGTSKQALNKL